MPISAWPKTVSPVTDAPPNFQHQAIHPGYSGDDHVRAIARKWHITMPKKSAPSFSGASKQKILSSEGVAHPAAHVALTLDVVWDSKGDLLLLVCMATAHAPQSREFLHSCTDPDFPGAKPTDTAAWLDAMEPQLDRARKKTRGVVVSPMHVTGPTGTYMNEYTDTTYGDSYAVETFGVVS
ncbi:hypothetical protein [Streptomyces sp. NPDC021020]|uniref:hypothetical protein n=1 Tax=Streptomyces sp. NPDC021020 TaxID=3365109 RepID=UPI0037A1C85F